MVVPIISSYSSADEAKVERNTEQEVRDYIAKDLDEALAGIAEAPRLVAISLKVLF